MPRYIDLYGLPTTYVDRKTEKNKEKWLQMTNSQHLLVVGKKEEEIKFAVTKMENMKKSN